MRLIDAAALCKEINEASKGTGPYRSIYIGFKNLVHRQPTIKAQPVRHGNWIEKQTTIQCSNCGKEYNDEIRCMCYGEDAELNHCPRCGAEMEGIKE